MTIAFYFEINLGRIRDRLQISIITILSLLTFLPLSLSGQCESLGDQFDPEAYSPLFELSELYPGGETQYCLTGLGVDVAIVEVRGGSSTYQFFDPITHENRLVIGLGNFNEIPVAVVDQM